MDDAGARKTDLGDVLMVVEGDSLPGRHRARSGVGLIAAPSAHPFSAHLCPSLPPSFPPRLPGGRGGEDGPWMASWAASHERAPRRTAWPRASPARGRPGVHARWHGLDAGALQPGRDRWHAMHCEQRQESSAMGALLGQLRRSTGCPGPDVRGGGRRRVRAGRVDSQRAQGRPDHPRPSSDLSLPLTPLRLSPLSLYYNTYPSSSPPPCHGPL